MQERNVTARHPDLKFHLRIPERQPGQRHRLRHCTARSHPIQEARQVDGPAIVCGPLLDVSDDPGAV